MSNTTKPRINPLSRRPRQQRLVLAVRGGAGTGKSWFLRSLAEAGLGRLCIFDVERKTRLLAGVGNHFDGLEIEHPDELPEFIDWALSGEGKEQNYGCFGLDSWAAYFSAKHAETIKAVRDRTNDPLAQPRPKSWPPTRWSCRACCAVSAWSRASLSSSSIRFRRRAKSRRRTTRSGACCR